MSSKTKLPRAPYWNMLTFQVLSGARDYYDRSWADNGSKEIASDFDRLYLIEEGGATVRSSDAAVHLVPGNVYLFPGGPVKRRYACSHGMLLNWVHCRVEAIPGLSIFARRRPPAEMEPDFDASAVFRDVIESIKNSTPQTSMQRVGLIARLLQPFMPETWEDILPAAEKTEQLQPALNFLQQNLTRQLTLGEIAETIHVHPTYFSNLFKSVIGMPPIRYHTELRLRRARGLLIDANRTITEVADACGFNDSLYFSRLFRRRTGVSPREFQQCRGRLEP